MSRQLIRALFLTHVDPAHFESRGSGIQQRFELLLDGLARVTENIDFVIMVAGADSASSAAREAAAAAFLSDRAQRPVSVRLVPLAREEAERGPWQRYVLAARSLDTLPGYRAYVGNAQLEAVASVLRQHRYDGLMVQRLCCAAIVLRLQQRLALPPVLFDLDDIEHVAYRRLVAQPPHWRSKPLAYLQLPALMRGERRALRLARASFVCAENDRRKLERLYRARNLEVIPNAVVPPLAPLPPAHAPTLLFVGIYGHAPNRAAAEFFLDHVWPRIRARVPTARVVFAGARPEAVTHYAAPPQGVSFTGFVADLQPLYAAARVVVCPLLSGGGTRVKIIEAAAYARPVVATRIGAEGLVFTDGEEILIRDAAAAFAAACITLLEDHAACTRMGLAARARVDAHYRRDSVAAHLASCILARLRIPPEHVGTA